MGLAMAGAAGSAAVHGLQDYQKHTRRSEALTNLRGFFTAMIVTQVDY